MKIIKKTLSVIFISLGLSLCYWIILIVILMKNSAFEPFQYMGY